MSAKLARAGVVAPLLLFVAGSRRQLLYS